MSNDLLLRLFNSSYFNVWLAVSYLYRYADNSGIQHYLCNELRKFPLSEIEYYLPQLLHFLMVQPDHSAAIEALLVDLGMQSRHVAVMCLWYLQAYLTDLSSNPSDPAFQLCKRALNTCHLIIFDDAEETDDRASMPYPTLPRVSGAVAGIGAVLAGIGQNLASLPIANSAKAMKAARQRDSLHSTSSSRHKPSLYSAKESPSLPNLVDRGLLGDHFSSAFLSQPDLPRTKTQVVHHTTARSKSLRIAHGKHGSRITRPGLTSSVTIDPLSGSNASRLSNELKYPHLSSPGSDSGISLPINPAPVYLTRIPSSTSSISSSRSEDPFDDDDSFYGTERKSPSKESTVDLTRQRQLLQSSYFQSEIQFVLALVNITTRLLNLPKSARMTSLRAELTLLNHNLPADICIPLWCHATTKHPHHHRIVRIQASEAVVLNSAERAPYMVLLEVLEGDGSIEETSSKDDADTAASSKQEAVGNVTHSLSESIDLGDCSPAQSPLFLSASAGTESQKSYTPNGTSPLTPEVMDHTNDHAERMHMAAIMLSQLQTTGTGDMAGPRTRPENEAIRERIMQQMQLLEQARMDKIRSGHFNRDVEEEQWNKDDLAKKMMQASEKSKPITDKEDPSAAVFKEDWQAKKARVQAASPYGHLPHWQLISVIVKSGSDLRQEQFAVQIIREMQRIWKENHINVWVKYFRILVTSNQSGLVETIRNTMSIHSIKKDAYSRMKSGKACVFTLADYYHQRWGPLDSPTFCEAQDAFMRSLAGYSVICYLLQIKDRHNGNLLIDDAGHIIHIDFGFMLSNSPGSVGFEMAPFKLSQEFIAILGGVQGKKFAEYKALMKTAFLTLRKHSESILLLVDLMSRHSNMPCFQMGEQTVQQLRDRFQPHLTESQVEEFVDKLITTSCGNIFTRLYDTYQYYSQGIL
ncbi:kinase-like domain-containing protein [Radiomyces spectabilis]|uniref:kinase-like domain-containing protein n=1 Tax=Radiomyces spectabilis TaxID=64574 RepID=UPI002220561B|nr:kinase-like domain-containing protein [Radiomyces spectabilis]KAI8376392.1 kinase-like domain-containing protein [Radiomyces spectabilis]